MAIFEKYHPIMSVHYTMDWLTQAKLKEVFILRHDPEIARGQERPVDANIGETAHFVNRAMALVMRNQALLYAVLDRSTGSLLGTLGLFDIDEERMTASIRLATLAGTDPAVMAEVLPRMLGFAVHELELQWLTAEQIIRPADAALYQRHHFAPESDRLVLDADRIINDEQYMF
ncbi:GNAT family N-acetyltransferase [Lacticaseibacillus thailandensis]|uniref:N-acetyltransferase domain-containing protein n=1 Tax=Lacticaseibacillus thailandensis DSM 22698 = JCM 13996 TaxID=1423810 RepID=A0A0R2C792_9LACO|nr:GNAT family N-acetyltransferase [Lacticaseibacillus thailandensis]KRM87093.1 hypothetical protein FD19_GL001244 [Lacticaseibacillus thailandensis DSM 22698 = JCM 13996]